MHGTKTLGMRSEIGKREKIHSTALGKAILSSLPQVEISEFVSQYEFSPVTPRTITDPAVFLDEMHETHQRGFALDDQENELGGRCVAAPIINHLGEPIAAISISVPHQRLPDAEISTFGKRVKAAAREISRRLGASQEKDT
jgi:DNA-binding IclR family transcriptional regulator